MASDDTVDVSETTLENAPGRALTFLLGVGSTSGAKAALLAVGYTAEEHALGWKLVHAVDTFNEIGRPRAELSVADELQLSAAVAELDALDEKWFAIAGASLEASHPEQHTFVFDGLAPSQGPSAVRGWQTFLLRYDALDKGPLAEGGAHNDTRTDAQRESDRAALDTLTRRGINAAFIANIRALLARAQSLQPVKLPTESEKKAAEAVAARRHSALAALYKWHRQWARIASKVITRRDWLITLGLAERKART